MSNEIEIKRTYIIEDLATIQTVPPRNRSRTGYGRKIPTRFMAIIPDLGKRYRRVYCCIYSNSGTCYVPDKDGNWHVIR